MATKKSSNPLTAISAGCIAGAVEATCVWPMEFIKTQLQLGSKKGTTQLPYNGVSKRKWTHIVPIPKTNIRCSWKRAKHCNWMDMQLDGWIIWRKTDGGDLLPGVMIFRSNCIFYLCTHIIWKLFIILCQVVSGLSYTVRVNGFLRYVTVIAHVVFFFSYFQS